MKGVVIISKTAKAEVKEDKENGEKIPIGARIFGILFTVFIYLLAAVILIGAILFAFSASPSKSLFGYRYYTVLTGSMSPKYNVGDMIFVKLSSDNDINVGDIITFNPSKDSDAYLTHRVTEKIENYEGTGTTCYRTKGDANDVGDSFLIESDRVIGKVTFGIPKLGYIVRFFQLRWYLIIPVAIMIAVFFHLLKRYFLMGKDDDDEDSGKEGDDSKEPQNESQSSSDTVSQSDGKTQEDGSPDETAQPAHTDTDVLSEETEASPVVPEKTEPDTGSLEI